MQKIIYKLTQYIIKLQICLHKKRIKKLQTLTQKASKSIILNDVDLDFNVDNEVKKLETEKKVRELVKKSNNNVEKILEFIKSDNINVFRLKNAHLLLKFIGEDEGFIPPLKGINAFFLNLFVGLFENKKLVFSCQTNEMFIFSHLSIDIYNLIHQLYLYYGFKAGLKGYTIKNKKKFNNILQTMKDEDISNLSVEEIIKMKDYIARDTEAIELVVNMAKETEATTKLINKIKGGKSVEL